MKKKFFFYFFHKNNEQYVKNNYLCPRKFGEMGERFKPAVLKTVVLKGTGGSNPSLSATYFDFQHIPKHVHENVHENSKRAIEIIPRFVFIHINNPKSSPMR